MNIELITANGQLLLQSLGDIGVIAYDIVSFINVSGLKNVPPPAASRSEMLSTVPIANTLSTESVEDKS